MKVSNRQAAQERDLQLEALAAFANMGDEPEEWRKFGLKFPRFFPDKSLYESASRWLAQTLEPFLPYTTTRLLLYRDHLRRVWAGNDQKGESLTILYGFEKKLNPVEPKDPKFGEPRKMHPLFLSGKTLLDEEWYGGRRTCGGWHFWGNTLEVRERIPAVSLRTDARSLARHDLPPVRKILHRGQDSSEVLLHELFRRGQTGSFE